MLRKVSIYAQMPTKLLFAAMLLFSAIDFAAQSHAGSAGAPGAVPSRPRRAVLLRRRRAALLHPAGFRA
jgi:hypothetical protein